MSEKLFVIIVTLIVVIIFLQLDVIGKLVISGLIGLIVLYVLVFLIREKKLSSRLQKLSEEQCAQAEKERALMLANSQNISYETACEIAQKFLSPWVISTREVTEYADYWVFSYGNAEAPDEPLIGVQGPCVVHKHTGEVKVTDAREPSISWMEDPVKIWRQGK